MDLEITIDKPNYVSVLTQIAATLKIKVEQDMVHLPEWYGQGYLKANQFDDALSIMWGEIQTNDPITIQVAATAETWYCLHFQELVETAALEAASRKNLQLKLFTAKNTITLQHTLMPLKLAFPPYYKVKFLKFCLHKKHLINFLPNEAVETLLSEIFPSVLLEKKSEPLDTDFRIIIEDIISGYNVVPFKNVFLMNRIRLLLEKYIQKLLLSKEHFASHNLDDNDVSRLMKVEALLIKDFSAAPPTIEMLSKISAMSPTKLKADFKKLYGLPIYGYYQKNRMMKAKNLLLQGKLSIKEVGKEVGYSNLSHFANAFRKEFGLLPSQLVDKDGIIGTQ